jgi:lipopolysaccharide biosynthesis glycosyltransferase
LSFAYADIASNRAGNMTETIPTLFCINANYTQHAAVCIVSLLENNRDHFFDIVVVTTDPLGSEENKLQKTVGGYSNGRVSVALLDTTICQLPVRAQHYTIDTYSRLWVAEFFPVTIEKVLYLDSDMVVVGPIGELWRTSLGNHALAAATIPGSDRCPAFNIPEKYGYFQSGVMLINLTKWRTNNILECLLKWISENGNKIVDADQDVLNACLYNERLVLDSKWNVISPFYFDYHPLGISDQELADVRRDARIIHYNGPSKPWHYLSRHPRRDDYWKYLNISEWRDYVPKDKTLANWTKRHFGFLLPKSLRAYIKRVFEVI